MPYPNTEWPSIVILVRLSDDVLQNCNAKTTSRVIENNYCRNRMIEHYV